jgi:cysteine desulfurase
MKNHVIVYLDYAATTPIDPRVAARIAETFVQVPGNPASQHRLGRRAKQVLEDAAEGIGRLIGARLDEAAGDRVVLTSGGTEANNLALFGLVGERPGRIVVAAIEHPSTLGAAGLLERRGWRVDYLQAAADGRVRLDHLDELLADPTPIQLVTVLLANNETGVLQPMDAIVARCQPRGIAVHTDAVQVAGKRPLDFAQSKVTTMAVAAHKFHGPCGVGALVVRGKTEVRPLLVGGAQQLGTRPGTESVALAVGMQAALQLAVEQLDSVSAHLQLCRDRLQQQLLEGDSHAVVNGTAPRVPQTLNISFPGVDRQALLMNLDLAGLCCSTGSACSSGSSEPSHVLQAMGLATDRIESALRLSVGAPTTFAEVDEATERILKAVKQLRG